jgi:hypothetical protein
MALASAITLVALPFLWVSKQSSSSSTNSGIAVIGDAGGIKLPSGSPVARPATGDASFVADEPGYLGGSIAQTAPGTIALSVKGATSGKHVGGAATYHALRLGGNVCQTDVAPVGTLVHVTDTDNGRSVDCKVIDRVAAPVGTAIVLGTDAFRVLAEVVESPIPVELAW